MPPQPSGWKPDLHFQTRSEVFQNGNRQREKAATAWEHFEFEPRYRSGHGVLKPPHGIKSNLEGAESGTSSNSFLNGSAARAANP